MAKKTEITILGIKKETVSFKIEGVSPLITHKWSDKNKSDMRDKQMQKATSGREAKNPEADYLATIYYFKDKQRTGFPAVAFKAAMVRAGKQLGYLMTDLRGMFFILSDEEDLIEIHGKHRLREDMVRVSNGSPDIRHRAEYPEWNATIRIRYNSSVISSEQLASLLNMAGFACGIGDFRPEKSNTGSFGLFEISN